MWYTLLLLCARITYSLAHTRITNVSARSETIGNSEEQVHAASMAMTRVGLMNA